MITLQALLAVAALVGLLTVYSSLFFLKDGLPKRLLPREELKKHYRAPGHALWMWGLGLITVGWLGYYTIELRLEPELARAIPLDLICIAVGSLALLISFFLTRRRAATDTEPSVPGATSNLHRLRGGQLAWIGALWLGAGMLMLLLIRVV